jgi:hypothetical protein
MAIPAGLSRVVLSGTSNSPEIWNTGFWMSGTALETGADCADAAETVYTKAVDGGFKTAFAACIGVGANWNKVSVYSHIDGGPLAAHVGFFDVPSGAGSSQTGANQILQTCCVASLRSDTAGRRGRGRMFLPAAGIPVVSGRFNSSINTLADNLAAMFSLLNALTDVTWNPCVLSNADSAFRPITSVVIDNRPDVQRRRANRFTSSSLRTAAVT